MAELRDMAVRAGDDMTLSGNHCLNVIDDVVHLEGGGVLVVWIGDDADGQTSSDCCCLTTTWFEMLKCFVC